MDIDTFLIFLLIGMIAGGYWLCKIKREEILLLVLTVFWGSAAIYSTVNETQLNCAKTNREKALQHCAIMLKAGEQARLQKKLTAFLETPERSRKAATLARAFAESLGVDSSPEWSFPSIVWASILAFLAGVWYAMRHFQVKSIFRRVYLATLSVLALGTLCLIYVGTAVQNGYARRGIITDLERLNNAVSQPQIHPQLLRHLEHPQMEGWWYLPNNFTE
ncbi:MAG: hypothetical protein IJJ33_03020 [Victivallales bacterium]|nr:hypothetical protein [Victivallales bacterium]